MRWPELWSQTDDDVKWRMWMEDNIGKVALQTLWENKVRGCRRCRLCETRTQIVFGIGNAERPDYAFVGEGPGEDEDRKGEPFVGVSGQLLTTILKAMGLSRNDVYLCNTVSCRPPVNRNPEQDELLACRPVWIAQLAAVRPRLIVALGKIAGNALLGKLEDTVIQMRQKVHTWNNTPMIVTYHPAAMLRNEEYKQPAWNDLQAAMKLVQQLKDREKDSGPLFSE